MALTLRFVPLPLPPLYDIVNVSLYFLWRILLSVASLGMVLRIVAPCPFCVLLGVSDYDSVYQTSRGFVDIRVAFFVGHCCEYGAFYLFMRGSAAAAVLVLALVCPPAGFCTWIIVGRIASTIIRLLQMTKQPAM